MVILVRPSPDTGKAKRETRNLGYKTFLNGVLVSNIVIVERNAVNRPDGRSINNCRDHHALTRAILLIHRQSE